MEILPMLSRGLDLGTVILKLITCFPTDKLVTLQMKKRRRAIHRCVPPETEHCTTQLVFLPTKVGRDATASFDFQFMLRTLGQLFFQPPGRCITIWPKPSLTIRIIPEWIQKVKCCGCHQYTRLAEEKCHYCRRQFCRNCRQFSDAVLPTRPAPPRHRRVDGYGIGYGGEYRRGYRHDDRRHGFDDRRHGHEDRGREDRHRQRYEDDSGSDDRVGYGQGQGYGYGDRHPGGQRNVRKHHNRDRNVRRSPPRARPAPAPAPSEGFRKGYRSG